MKMRSRKEIEEDLGRDAMGQEYLLEVLLDIRDLLTPKETKTKQEKQPYDKHLKEGSDKRQEVNK